MGIVIETIPLLIVLRIVSNTIRSCLFKIYPFIILANIIICALKE